MADAQLPAGTGIGRVALRVNDAERVARFYESVVGLEPVTGADQREVPDDGRALGAGGTPLVVLLEDPAAPERRRDQAGLFHVAVRVPTRAALGDAFTRIESEWELTGASDHLVSEALYLRDPEGNGVEVYWDRPRAEWPTAENGRVQMDTRALDLDELQARAEGQDRAPPGTDVGHVHLEVTDVEAARECYVDGVGFEVRQAWGADALFVAAGGYHHHVGLNAWNGRTAPAGGRGLAWFEVVVPDAADVDRALARCESLGLDVTRDGAATVVDPDGIEVRIRVAGD